MPLYKEIAFRKKLVGVVLVAEAGPKKFGEEEYAAAVSQSYEKGFQEALKFCQDEQGREQQKLLELQRSTFEKISSQHEALAEHFCGILPGLVMQAVGRILAVVEFDRAIVTGIVTEMLAEIHPGKGELEVGLSQHDLELFAGNEANFRQKYPGICFVADPELQPGDCVVRSRFGTFDGQVQTKLENLEALLE